VDSMTSCELLSFLDAYSGYHQISLTVDDEEKTVFTTPFGIFCYTEMAFGLKNGGATYQKCVHIVLEGQIKRNVEAYIDDIVVKSEKRGDLLDDLKEAFDNLRKFKMMFVIPHSEITEMKPPYVCSGCLIHTYSNNMINRCHIQ
jgi:hypothetical protein